MKAHGRGTRARFANGMASFSNLSALESVHAKFLSVAVGESDGGG